MAVLFLKKPKRLHSKRCQFPGFTLSQTRERREKYTIFQILFNANDESKQDPFREFGMNLFVLVPRERAHFTYV